MATAAHHQMIPPLVCVLIQQLNRESSRRVFKGVAEVTGGVEIRKEYRFDILSTKLYSLPKIPPPPPLSSFNEITILYHLHNNSNPRSYLYKYLCI